jgi:HpcH/HpaI aldolase/citrate lyase family
MRASGSRSDYRKTSTHPLRGIRFLLRAQRQRRFGGGRFVILSQEYQNPGRSRRAEHSKCRQGTVAKRELALGVGIRLVRTVEIAKVMKTAGFDFLFIDLEHGAMSIDTAVQMSVAALDVGIAPIVRVPSRQFFIATRVLDGGALGIVMPHVDSADEARDPSRAVRRKSTSRRTRPAS